MPPGDGIVQARLRRSTRTTGQMSHYLRRWQ